jgi:anti-sigma regulatory factor (Ser/Thr protein kinase)
LEPFQPIDGKTAVCPIITAGREGALRLRTVERVRVAGKPGLRDLIESASMTDRFEHNFPCTSDTPAKVRALLRNLLATWAIDDLTPTAELLTTELVTNAVRHAHSPITVRAFRRATVLRVEVDDSSAQPPVLRRADPCSKGGRGLMVVAAMASEWGTIPQRNGKTVWFELDVSAPGYRARSGEISF